MEETVARITKLLTVRSTRYSGLRKDVIKVGSLFDNPSIEGRAFLRWNDAIIAVENPTNDFSVNYPVLNI